MSYCSDCGTFRPDEQETHSNKEMSLPAVLFSFRGRINRKTFWLKGIGPLAALLAASLGLITITPPDAAGGLALLLIVLHLYVWMAVCIKRLHDFDQPATWSLWYFPFLWFFVVFGIFIGAAFAEGTQGPNRYGDQP